MAPCGHICRRTGTIFGRTQLKYYLNISDKFKNNLTSGLGGVAITSLLQVLNKGLLAILNMVAVQPHLLTDLNRFWTDTSRHWEEFICKVSTKFLQWFRRRCDNGENQKWLPAAIFVDGSKLFSDKHNYTTIEISQISFGKIWPAVSEEMR